MLSRRIAKALSICALVALPALAAEPNFTVPAGLHRGMSAPRVDSRNARVIVKYKADGALMREHTQSARDPDKAKVQFAARMSQRLGIALRDGREVMPRTQVLHAKDMSSAALVAALGFRTAVRVTISWASLAEATDVTCSFAPVRPALFSALAMSWRQ